MSIETSPDERATPASSSPLALQAYLFIGALFFLANFSGPHLGLIDVPVSFFLKNRLHLSSNQTAVFRLFTGVPLIVGFVFGFVRDSWSPFGRGDRAHLVIFSLVTTLIYGALTLFAPTYSVLLLGVLLATVSFQMVYSVANGLTTVVGQANALAGGLAAATLIAAYLPQVIGYLLGGVLSTALESQNANNAAKIIFLCGASLMLLITAVSIIGPRRLFEAGERTRPARHVRHDLHRFARHWPIYPVIAIQLLWQFSPATGTVLQYHLSNTLHATDAQWGEWNALFIAFFIPGLMIYAWLCRRVPLKWLLWGGFVIGTLQLVPFLFIKTANAALIAAAILGVLGAFAQGSLVDLSIRSAPKGLEGTMAMLFLACYYVSTRGGDLFGTALYDHFGFTTPVIATIVATALVLPILLLVPKRLITTRDGESLQLDP